MQWSTRGRETGVAGVLALALAAGALGADPVGRALLGAAALLLAVVAASDLVRRPRLRADDDGVVVRRGGRRLVLPWPRVTASVRTTRRLGTRSRTLEIEDRADDTLLVVLGRRDLGADPEEVAGALWARGAGRA